MFKWKLLSKALGNGIWNYRKKVFTNFPLDDSVARNVNALAKFIRTTRQQIKQKFIKQSKKQASLEFFLLYLIAE